MAASEWVLSLSSCYHDAAILAQGSYNL